MVQIFANLASFLWGNLKLFRRGNSQEIMQTHESYNIMQ